MTGKNKTKTNSQKKNQKSKTKLYAHYKCSSVCICGNSDANNSFKTKLNSFILQTCAKFMRQGLHLIITSCICSKCGDNLTIYSVNKMLH